MDITGNIKKCVFVKNFSSFGILLNFRFLRPFVLKFWKSSMGAHPTKLPPVMGLKKHPKASPKLYEEWLKPGYLAPPNFYKHRPRWLKIFGSESNAEHYTCVCTFWPVLSSLMKNRFTVHTQIDYQDKVLDQIYTNLGTCLALLSSKNAMRNKSIPEMSLQSTSNPWHLNLLSDFRGVRTQSWN